MTRTDAEVALAAARAGAGVVASRYGGLLDRHAKSGHDFATDADLQAEAAILAVLRTERPDDALVGEESGATGPAADRTWPVDPLCGTLNFAATTPLVAVNVALRSGSSLVAAAVADPIADEAWWTDGSEVRTGDGDPVLPSSATRLVDVNVDGFRPGPGVFDPGSWLRPRPSVRGSARACSRRRWRSRGSPSDAARRTSPTAPSSTASTSPPASRSAAPPAASSPTSAVARSEATQASSPQPTVTPMPRCSA